MASVPIQPPPSQSSDFSNTTIVLLIGVGGLNLNGTPIPSTETLVVNEYGKEDNIKSITNHLLKIPVKSVEVMDVSISNAKDVISSLGKRVKKDKEDMIVMNLCDGNEEGDGYPGLSVIKYLEDEGVPFTGSRSEFYIETHSKIHLKGLLLDSGVPTSQFVVIEEGNEESCVLEGASMIGWPMILKPSVSYASLAISYSSVVRDLSSALSQISRVHLQTTSPLFLERFLPGREFTVLVTGDTVDTCRVYKAAERVFDQRLPVEQRLLAFDKYWEGCDLEGEGKKKKEEEGAHSFMRYEVAPDEFQDVLQDVAKRAYFACKGTGYGRVDLRTTSTTSAEDVMVLEVNAQCGLGFDKDSSSMAEILIMSGIEPSDFLTGLFETSRNRMV